MHHPLGRQRTALAAAIALAALLADRADALDVGLISLFAFQQRTAGIVQAYYFEIEV